MTEDDNSSWIFANSSFERKNWKKVQSENGDAVDLDSTDLKHPSPEGSSVKSGNETIASTTAKALNMVPNDTSEKAIESARKALNVSDSETLESDAVTPGKVLNISGNASTNEMTTDGESAADVTKSTKMMMIEYGTHVLNTRGSAGNTTDVMDILSDPDRKKWPAEERVEGESLVEPVRRLKNIFQKCQRMR